MKYHEIDFARWNQTMVMASNSLPYAYAWYLDAVSPNWEALVTDDYAYVMPLPVKRKFGVKYVIQPRWTQQIGVFSAQPITDAILEAFRDKIPYLSYDININFANKIGEEFPNRIIDLSQNYNAISQQYTQNTHRNIAKAQSKNLVITVISCAEFLEFWQMNGIQSSTEMLNVLRCLAVAADNHQIARFYGVKTAENRLVAALFALETEQRIINLAPVSNAEGKQLSAMFLLIDHLLKINSESSKIFDFEGSKIPGVARFYEGFGAHLQNYYHVKRCRPDWLVKLLHR